MKFSERVWKLQGELSKADMKGAVVTSNENVRYLAGYRGFTRLPRGVVVPASGDPTLIVAQGDEGLARALTPFAVRTYPISGDSFRGMIGSCGSCLKDLGITHGLIGLEVRLLTVEQYRSCESVISDFEFNDITGHLTELRTIKDAEEQIELRHAADLAVIGATTGLREFRSGATEVLIKSAIERNVFVEGSRMWPEAAIETEINVLTGPKMKRLHDFGTGRVISPGDICWFFEGIACNGYWANVARTLILPGTPKSSPLEEVLQIVGDAHHAALDSIAPGVTLKVITRAADEILSKHGLDNSKIYPMFRGLGLTAYERPSLADLDNPLKLGMSLCVQLYVSVEDASLGLSDTVLVTEKGADVLTLAVQ
jgi:Xaa-Pro aminopeptidase